jgi:hypothetical protein
MDKGYEVNYTFTPKSGGNDEYFIYITWNDKKQMIFSKWKQHEKDGVVLANEISVQNVQKIVDKIDSITV